MFILLPPAYPAYNRQVSLRLESIVGVEEMQDNRCRVYVAGVAPGPSGGFDVALTREAVLLEMEKLAIGGLPPASVFSSPPPSGKLAANSGVECQHPNIQNIGAYYFCPDCGWGKPK